MVNPNRITDTPRREFPIRNGLINRREILRRRLRQNRPTVARRLFSDIDEHIEEFGRSINNDGSDLPELAFTHNSPSGLYEAPSSPLYPPVEIHQEIEPTLNYIDETYYEYSSDDSFSTAYTIVIAPNNNNPHIEEYLYRLWESRAIIRTDANIQTSAVSSPSNSPVLSRFSYSPPCYSPVNLNDIEELDHASSMEPLFSDTDNEDLIADAEINRLLDYIENEYYLENEP